MSELKLKLKFFYSTREYYQETVSFVFGKVKNGSFCSSSNILTSIINNQIKSILFNRVINKQQKSNNTFELKHVVIV
jgi:hypothetical protein